MTRDSFFKERFVLKDARKKFACFTVEEAKESFLARKAKQKKILQKQIANIDSAVYKIENNLWNP